MKKKNQKMKKFNKDFEFFLPQANFRTTMNTTENILILDLNNIKTVSKLSTFYLRKLITMYNFWDFNYHKQSMYS